MRVFLFFLLLSTVGAAAQPLAPGYASAAQNLRLRGAPSSSAHHVSSVPEGYPVQLGLCENGWCEVRYVGVQGYVPERHLTFRRQPLNPQTVDAELTDRSSDPAHEDSPPAEVEQTLSLTPLAGQPAPDEFRDDIEADEPNDQTIPDAGITEAETPPATAPNRRTDPVATLPIRTPSENALDVTETEEPDPSIAESAETSEIEEPDDAIATDLLTNVRPAPPAVIEQAPRLCPTQLEEAQQHYRDRDFEMTLDLVSDCLTQGSPTPEETVPAYRLLSLVYADTNEEAEAEQALLRLLAADPTYEPNRPYDPLHYVALVSSVRQDLGLSSSGFQCDWELSEAHGFYVTATFDRAIQVLRVCLDKPDRLDAEAIWSYRLIALSHLRQSNLAEARQAVLAIVALDPEYRADPIRDIPGYVALVDLVRQQREENVEYTRGE